MKASRKILLGLAVFAALLGADTPAFADPGRDNGRGHGRGQERGNWDRHDNDRHRRDTYIYRNYDHRESGRMNYNYQRNVGRPAIIKIYDNDRVILGRYVEDRYRYAYPKDWRHRHHNYQRRYMIGYPLPHGITYYSVPYDIRSRLRPTPIGYQYVRVDNDVLLMNQATSMIVDAVTLFASIR